MWSSISSKVGCSIALSGIAVAASHITSATSFATCPGRRSFAFAKLSLLCVMLASVLCASLSVLSSVVTLSPPCTAFSTADATRACQRFMWRPRLFDLMLVKTLSCVAGPVLAPVSGNHAHEIVLSAFCSKQRCQAEVLGPPLPFFFEGAVSSVAAPSPLNSSPTTSLL